MPWTYVVGDINDEQIAGTLYEEVLQKTNQKKFRVEKVINKKGNELFTKWKA